MNTTEPEALTFADAYDRLKAITETLNSDTETDIDPDRLIELLSEGKGLEAALRARLDDVEQQIRAIESGEGVRAYRVVPAVGQAPGPARNDIPVSTQDFAAAPPRRPAPADDDIPF